MSKGQSKKDWYHKNIEHVKNYNRRSRIDFPERYLYRKAKNNAQQSNREFGICVEDIVIPAQCPVLSIPIAVEGHIDNSPSLDRFDSSRGYVKDNINVMSWRANRLKGGATLEELKQIVTWMEKHGQEKL